MLSNQIIWSKTLLSSYGYLERLCKCIDKLVEKTALNSYYSYKNSYSENSIIGIADNIIRLSNRKIDYINLKVIVEKALRKMSNMARKVLILKYINKMSAERICLLLNISSSALYKKLSKALNAFFIEVAKLGYGEAKLEVIYLEDNFIKSIYDLVRTKNYSIEEKADVITNRSVYNDFVSSLIAKVC